MTTATRPVPTHGKDDRCYRHGCRREECRDAYRNTRKRAALRRERGIAGNAPGPRVAAHLQRLLQSGWTRLEIANASKVSERSIRYILAGQREVRIAKAAALLAVQPRTEQPRTDPTGSRRRIQALACIGWPISYTAQQAGFSASYAFAILRGDIPAMPRTMADQLAGVYRQLACKQGPSAYTRGVAIRNGWHGPLAWDEIDDPAVEPEHGNIPDPDLKREELASLRKDEVWLLSTAKISDHEIAARVGLAHSTVRQLLQDRRTGTKRDRKKVPA